MQDKRIFNTSKHRFRARYRLDSLNLQDPRSRLGCGQSYSFQDKLVLHEAVFAMTTTGPSERHWTTYCFDEHFFADEPRLEGEDEDEDEQGEEEEDDEDDEEDDDEEPPANIDPILTEPELNVNSWLPRQYSLVALATQLERISGYHSDVHEVFKHNLDLYVCYPLDVDVFGSHSLATDKKLLIYRIQLTLFFRWLVRRMALLTTSIPL